MALKVLNTQRMAKSNILNILHILSILTYASYTLIKIIIYPKSQVINLYSLYIRSYAEVKVKDQPLLEGTEVNLMTDQSFVEQILPINRP